MLRCLSSNFSTIDMYVQSIEISYLNMGFNIFIVGDFNVDTSSAITNPNINVNNFQNMFLS